MCFKIVLVGLCLAFVLGNALGQGKSGYNGRPGCKTMEEMQVKLYRNFWDPTAYWECVTLGVPGVARRCYDGYAFLTSRRGCIPFMDWVWEPEVLPPSRPDGADVVQTASPMPTKSV